jgi:23S rRNA 5-hydroxycytidine C2501 synthase
MIGQERKREHPNHPIELLAPAADLACGLAALDHGADAVYIGGPHFGARAAAANSIKAIEKLVAHAHGYRARVYVALNTLLGDEEIPQAVALAHQLYQTGADALIIQDMGLFEADLPPIALHASTQMNNRTPAKVRFLEEIGLQQVVLARELSLTQIRQIRAVTSLPLEFFVHGALCVSYSGQCYLSEVMAGRSANRGECAQYCRHRFSLFDQDRRRVGDDGYLLSLKDLDLSSRLGELLAAGISSFKIEGRLKDISYVKNVTAFYRLALDRLIAADSRLRRASAGQCDFAFAPDPEKSFHRGRTEYFLDGGRQKPGAIDTPKSTGKELGRVEMVGRNFFTIAGRPDVQNGDGLCYLDARRELVGMRVNRVEGAKIFLRQSRPPPRGTRLFRNLDTAFQQLIAASQGCRKIAAALEVRQEGEALLLGIVDEDGIASETVLNVASQRADQPGTVTALAEKQLRKTGGTLFSVVALRVVVDPASYYPAAVFNELRRAAFDRHLAVRIDRHRPPAVSRQQSTAPWPSTEFSYQDNITNRFAARFYRRHGQGDLDPARLNLAPPSGCALMTSRYCLRAQLGICPREKGRISAAQPLVLADQTAHYHLRFDCRACQMTLHLITDKTEP